VELVITCVYCLTVKVRLFDPSSSVRRPVLSVDVEDCPLTSLCLQPNKPQYATHFYHHFVIFIVVCTVQLFTLLVGCSKIVQPSLKWPMVIVIHIACYHAMLSLAHANQLSRPEL